ncbi:MAG: hypothetical protein LC650_04405, partial [Actinobacteria bacterium]|nr:hypothetical protein [Actinomycetota bacterium]
MVQPEDGGPFYNITEQRTEVQMNIGFCGAYEYPRSVNGLAPDELGTVGIEEHSYILTYGDPWCNSALVFVTCLEERPTAFHPPAYALNVRPPVLHDSSAVISPVPPKLPMWDQGGYFYRVATVRIDDSCLDPRFDPSFEIRSTSKSRVVMSIINGSLTYGFPDVLNVSDSSSEDWTRSYLTSRLAECSVFGGAPTPECVVSHTTCSRAPVAKCRDAQRTRPITRYPSRVTLACRDPEYGYVWRIGNDESPGLHFDWRLTRRGGGGNGTLIDPVNAPGDLAIPSNTSRNLLYDAPLINGFWPGTSGKHTAERLSWFYLPTWLDSGNVTRPSHLDLYAGFPNHYQGTTTLGALVAFFDFDVLFNGTALNATGFMGFSYDDVPEPAFPDDFERQMVLYVCSVPGLATAASLYVTGGAEDWVGWCDATVLNDTATWPDALALTQATFAGLFPGDPDPMPECLCGTEGDLKCSGDTQFGQPMNMQYDYLRTTNRTIDYRMEPVCRMPLPGDPVLQVNDLPPYSYFPGPSSPVNYALAPQTEVNGFLSYWPEPSDLTTLVNGTTVLNYTTSPFGVMWNLSNVNRDPIAISITAQLVFANAQSGNSSAPNTSDITVPYEYLTGDVVVQPNRTAWLLSRTLIGQNIYGHINWPCDNAADCEAESPPQYPPDYSPLDPAFVASPAFDSVDIHLPQVDVDALPPCECYVNIPCDGGQLLEETDLDVLLSNLTEPPEPPAGPPTYVNVTDGCVPTLEICNCLDDNCDGFVDNVLGLGTTCGISSVGRCELGTFDCNVSVADCAAGISSPLICNGAIYPSLEKCDGQDWDCDGVPNNPSNLGTECGSDVGICEFGTVACDSPNPEPVCVGGVLPEPEDICGNGLDDDCDGLIDFNCVPAPPPTGLTPT